MYKTLVHNWTITAEVERMHVFTLLLFAALRLKKGCCIDRYLFGYCSSEMSIYKVLCSLYRHTFFQTYLYT